VPSPAAGRSPTIAAPIAQRALARFKTVERVGIEFTRAHPRVIAALKLAGYVICGVLLVGVGVRAVRTFSPEQFRPGYLVAAAVVGLISWGTLGAGWSVLCSPWVGSEESMWTWVRTQFLRYLPGGVWGPATRAKAAPGRLRQGAALVLLENVLALTICGSIGMLILGITGHHSWLLVPLLGLVIVAGAARASSQFGLRPQVVAVAAVVYLISFFAYGVMGVLAQTSVGGGASSSDVFAVSLVAWVVGVVVVTAPGGLGAREGVYVLGLTHVLANHGPFSAGAVASRLAMLAAEVAFLGIVALIVRLLPIRSAPVVEPLPADAVLDGPDVRPVAEG
jgi:uncharacterized membrane protein YbhN (UPF0104 family)